MKLFLAGGTGVVGRRAIPALVVAGHDVTALSRTTERDALVERLGGTPARVGLFDRDGLCGAVAGHDVVLNLATNIPPMTKAASASAWETNTRIRTEGAANLVAAAEATGAGRMIQESITFPYEDRGDEWIDEQAPRPPSVFSAPVDAAESAAVGFRGAHVVLRFAQFNAPEASHTHTFLSAYRKGLSPLAGDPDGYWSFIHADDAASAVVAAVEAPPGIYNIAEDEPARRRDVDAAVADALGRKRIRTVPKLGRKAVQKVNPGAAVLMRSHRISNRAFREATGWAPVHRTSTVSMPEVLAAAQET